MKSKKFSISFQDESFQKVLPLNIGQYTIGSDSRCDLVIDHDDVSKYLGVIIVTKNSLTFVNTANAKSEDGKIILREEIKSSLSLSEGSFHFEFKSEIIELPDIPVAESIDGADALPQAPVKELEQAFDMDKVQIYNKDGAELFLIDDEWCDIVFDESKFAPVADYRFQEDFKLDNFIDTDDEIDTDEAHRALFKQSDKFSIEISFLVNGIVNNIDYFSANESKIYLSGEREAYNTFKVETFDHKKYAFALCKKDEIIIRDIPGFTKQVKTDAGKLNALPEGEVKLEGETIVYTCGVTQIIVKKKALPPKVKLSPWFQVDRELAKVTGLLWLLLVLPILSIVFFTTIEQAEKKKEIAVIYKKVKGVKKDAKLSQAAEGPINKEQPKKQEPPKPVEQKKVEQKVVKNNSPAKKSNKITKTKPTKAKFKRYSFNSVSKVSSILGKTSSVNAKVNKRSADVAALPSSSSNALAKGFGKVSQKVGTIGNGGGRAGYDRNVAGTGFGDKNGVDTSYISTETKVLGSIDPELIRKILREHLEQFRYCYQKELLNNDVSGVFYLDFQINQGGRAPAGKINVSTKSFKFSSTTIGCLQKVVGLIQFPKPKGGGVVDIRQPLNFVSAKSR